MPVKSQTVPDYHSLKELEKYYGTWIYEANGKYFKIVLKKQVYTDNHDGWGLFEKWPPVFGQTGHIFRSKLVASFR